MEDLRIAASPHPLEDACVLFINTPAPTKLVLNSLEPPEKTKDPFIGHHYLFWEDSCEWG